MNSTEMNTLLSLKNISRYFENGPEKLQILDDVNLDIRKGETVAIVGPSGSGKSTLLYLMGLLDRPSEGSVTFNGQSLEKANDRQRSKLRNADFGFIYQYHHLLPEFTAFENVLMPALIGGKANKAMKARVVDLLDRVGLKHRLEHYPAELSGGEQQRVAVARALLNQPKLLLADEPTGNLDAASADKVFNLFTELVKESDAAVIVVTHNPNLAAKCDRIYRIEAGKLFETEKIVKQAVKKVAAKKPAKKSVKKSITKPSSKKDA